MDTSVGFYELSCQMYQCSAVRLNSIWGIISFTTPTRSSKFGFTAITSCSSYFSSFPLPALPLLSMQLSGNSIYLQWKLSTLIFLLVHPSLPVVHILEYPSVISGEYSLRSLLRGAYAVPVFQSSGRTVKVSNLFHLCHSLLEFTM